jgi:hypothetical protein
VTVEPGWYPDPAGSPDLRFWDGTTWTSHTAAAVAAAPVTPAPESYAPANYGPTNYGQPNYGPANYGQPAAPYGNPWQQAPKKRSRLRVLLIVLGSLVGLGVIAAIVSGVVTNQKNKSVYDHTSIAMPAALDGLTRSDGADATTLSSLTSSIDFPEAHLGGVYKNSAGARAAVLIVGKARFDAANQASFLTSAENGFHSSQTQPTAFHNADPGPLGGKMRCTTWTLQGVQLTACFFADAGAIGAIVLPRANGDAFAATLRSGIEKRT